MEDLLGPCSQRREKEVQCRRKIAIQGSPFSYGAVAPEPHCSTSVLAVLCMQQFGQAWGMPFSACEGQGGKPACSPLSCPLPAPLGSSLGGENKEQAVFCLLSLCLSIARAALGALRPLRPQGQKKQGPGSSQTRKLVAFSDCTGPRVEICWSYCTPVPLLPFLGGPFLPTVAIQLLSVSSPLIHFLHRRNGSFQTAYISHSLPC